MKKLISLFIFIISITQLIGQDKENILGEWSGNQNVLVSKVVIYKSNNDILIKDIYPNGKFNEKSAIIIKDSKGLRVN